MISLIIAVVGCFLLSFIVFGGGQIFIPFFKILLVDMMHVDDNLWQSALTLSNATPGVFSLKLAFVTGYLAAYGEWWGYLAMFLTYTAFIIVPMVIMVLAMKVFNKLQTNKYMIIVNHLMKPVIAGILIALSIQLLISVMFPLVQFNELNNYAGIAQHPFFRDWRLWAAIAFVPVDIGVIWWMTKKYKINIIWIILANIVLAMIVFQPWLV